MHYFIEHSQLSAQTSADLNFGPDAQTPTTKFNVTTQFQLTTVAKAFACEDGLMFVQANASSSSLVNIVIKPSTPSKVNGYKVKYYFYRGIEYSSFFTEAGQIQPEGVSSSELINAFWRFREKISAQTAIGEAVPLHLGFGENSLPLTDPTNLNPNRPLADIFNGLAPAKPFKVTQGMWIGNFTASAKIGFEVELDTELGVVATLGTARSNILFISTDSLTDLPLKKRRELINAYIDPSALFGMHCDVGINASTYTGTTKNTVLKKISLNNGFYSDLIVKFQNKNRVYIDIRSERGLTYNFYNTYRISTTNAANLRLNNAAEAAAVEYSTSGWPVLFFSTILNQNTSLNKFSLRLHTGQNPKPVLFLENKKNSSTVAKQEFNFYKGNQISETSTPNWTKNITLYYPNARDASHNNISTKVKLQYFLGDPVTTSTNRLLNRSYFDSAFCSIDLENLGDASVANGLEEGSSPIYIKESLQPSGTGNFSYAGETGAYWDSTRVLFYCKSFSKISGTDGSDKRYLSTNVNTMALDNSKFANDLQTNFYYVCKKYETDNGDLKILGLNSYHIEEKLQEKEDLLLLGLSIDEINTLKNTVGLSVDHPRFIFLDPDQANHLTDNSSHHYRYYSFSVKLQGLNSLGQPTVVSPTSEIKVYSRDKQFFTSSAFSAEEEYSAGSEYPGDSRIVFSIHHDGRIFINDNIDFALVRKSILLTEHTVGPDNSIAGDTSEVQKIFFQYYPLNATEPTQISSFNFVMSNKMKRSGTQASIPAGYNLSITYTAGDAKRSFTNNQGDIITTNAATGTGGTKKLYSNLKKKVFMVHFVTAETVAASGYQHVFTLQNNTLGIVFSYSATRRRFVNPDFAAAVLGALVVDNNPLTSTGFSFGDGSSYPSAEHVNGNAIDSIYFMQPPSTWQEDVDFISALDQFGIRLFRIGMHRNTLNTNLSNEDYYSKVKVDTDDFKISETKTLHDTHLHSAYVVLKSR